MNLLTGIGSVIGQVWSRVEGIVSAIIDFFRSIAYSVYGLFIKAWDYFMTNPKGMIYFLANMWVLMY